MHIGDEDTRTAIQERHGGSLSRGIAAPSRRGGPTDIMLWWRPERGELFGYADGWTPEGDAFYFSGLGQDGDQGFDAPYQENGRLRDHAMHGDHVRLLKYLGKNRVRYVGELRLDPSSPWHWRDGPDRIGEVRKIVQFRLLPIGTVLRDEGEPVRRPPSISPVAVDVAEQRSADVSAPVPTDVEGLYSRSFRQLRLAREVLARRRELELVYRFRDWVIGEFGLEATGLRIPYAPESRDLRVDLFLKNPRLLIEAKASASREHIRLAIGQLLDYRRWLEPAPATCILVPTAPAPDMLDLLRQLDIGAAWRVGAGFTLRPEGMLKV